LHSCFDDIRSKLMPINNAYNLDQIITWIKTNYPKKSSKKLTIEYTLIENINDRDEDIEKIITLLKETNVLINVISYNKVINSEHQPSRKIDTFVKKLISNGFKVTTRLSLGNDINAACGQLRINYGKV
jgi:23S rRNA (adenine2503-C2)-methyltransferase